MTRRLFFSFDYDRDIMRANQVRNSWVTQDREAAGFWDASLWEEAKKKGKAAIRRMIDEGLESTSVTAVLIGAETSKSEWVLYEIEKSYERGNGLLGVHIHMLEDISRSGRTDRKGSPDFGKIGEDRYGNGVYFPGKYGIYDYKPTGYAKLGEWVEKAARDAGR